MVFAFAVAAKKAALDFGMRRWVSKSTKTMPNRFWYP
jgi:hypothetical protein